jgi:hypothetical protein
VQQQQYAHQPFLTRVKNGKQMQTTLCLSRPAH